MPATSSPQAKEENTAQAPGPLFVVSMWRSGSSLLYALLNKHPQVGLMYEADLLLLRSVFLKPAGYRDWAERWQFWNQAFRRHGLDAAEFSEPLMITSSLSLRGICHDGVHGRIMCGAGSTHRLQTLRIC